VGGTSQDKSSRSSWTYRTGDSGPFKSIESPSWALSCVWVTLSFLVAAA
jgi:hypothetical protein